MNLTSAVLDLLSQKTKCGSTHIISIDGPAGAGKTTLAMELFLALSLEKSVLIIHLDEIYNGWQDGLGDSLTRRLEELLNGLSQEKPTLLPIYDWSKGTFTSEREIDPCDVLIIEGVGAAQAVVRRWSTATIWLDISPAEGLKRVLERDGAAIEENMLQWQIQEAAHFLADKTRENSDFILSTS
jgi:uridine kinase